MKARNQKQTDPLVRVESTGLFGMLSAADPELEKCVLICYRNGPREKLVWMVGVFRKLNGGIWFRCDGTQQGFPYRNVPGVADSTARWMYLPNA